MNEMTTNPCDPLVDAIAEAVARKLAARNGPPQAEDRLLSAEEAVAMLSVSVDWLYRHAKKLPFTRKLGPKMVRFSTQGINPKTTIKVEVKT